MSESSSIQRPAAYLFSFPFWLFTDPKSQLETTAISWRGHDVVLYPPFRSGRMAFNGTPSINPATIPPESISEKTREELLKQINHTCKYPNLVETKQYKSGPDGRWKAYQVAVSKGVESSCGEDWASSVDDYKETGFPMDSLRVDVRSSAKENRSVAEHFVQKFLTGLRLKCNQWWILRNISPLQGFLRGGAYLDNSSHEITSETFGAFPLSKNFFGFEQLINENMWREAAHDDSDLAIIRPQLLWLDAAWHAQSNGLYQVPINLCVALEMAVESRLTKPFLEKGVNPKRSKIMKSSGLPGYLDQDCKRVLGHSLKVEKPATYEVIKELWEVRGQVAHGVEPVIFRNGERKNVTFTEAGNYFSSTSVTIDWLSKILV